MLIVDVFNVLHAAPKAAPELGMAGSGGLVRLGRAIPLSRFGGEPAWLVCDGTAGGLGARLAEQVNTDLVHVICAGPGKDADALIEQQLDHLERAGRLGGVMVVSNDRRVQAAAVGVRARWMSSDAFLSALADDLRRRGRAEHQRTGGRPELAAREALDEGAAAAWLREFGFAGPATPAASGEASSPNIPASTSPARKPEPDPRDSGEDRRGLLDERTIKELEEWAKGLGLDDKSDGDRNSPPSPSTPPPGPRGR